MPAARANTRIMSDDDAFEPPDIVTVIGRYGPLIERGKRGFQGYCPLCSHIEGTLFVRPDLQEWHCFECGAGGDMYDFVSLVERISREEAIATVRQRFAHREEQPAAAAVPAAMPAAPPRPSLDAGEEDYRQFFLQVEKAPGYQGAAVFDASARLLARDERYPIAPDVAELGRMLATVFDGCERLLPPPAGVSKTTRFFSLAAPEGALLLIRAGCGADLKLVIVRIGDPAAAAAARLRVLAACELIAPR